SDMNARLQRCPKMARSRPVRVVSWTDGPGRSPALSRPDVARRAIRRHLLRRRHLDRHLLPADLPGEDAEGGELPLLRHASASRAGRIPAVPALPPGAGAG